METKAIVRFNRWDEFVEELQSAPPDDMLVRLTFSIRHNGQRSPYLTMVAGYVRANHIVEFVDYFGVQEMDDGKPQSREINVLFEKRKETLAEQGFIVRSGRYHVPLLVRWQGSHPE